MTKGCYFFDVLSYFSISLLVIKEEAYKMISWWGALIGLALAIFLILRKLDPVYSLLLGAIVGAIIGGAGL